MKTLLPLLALFAVGEVQAQTLNIGPNGISFSSGNTPNDVTVQFDKNGLQVSPSVRRAPAPILGSQFSRLECAGRAVSVRGSGQNLMLTGRCPQVTVSGSGNTVRVAQVGKISVSGSRNTVIWSKSLTGARPSTRLSGSANRVLAAAPAAPVRAAPVQPARPAPAASPQPTQPIQPRPPQTAQRL